MNGFIKKTVTTLCLTGGLVAGQGCYTYRELVDPCYPDRYVYQDRQSVIGHLAPQVYNGHALDQTVWNYHFERDANREGNERLTAGGREKLLYLIRRRPHPDPIVYLATAQDIRFTTGDEFIAKRSELDNKRIEAIKAYLAAQSAGRDLTFQVVVHDPFEVGQHAAPVARTIQGYHGAAQGVLGVGAGGAAPSGTPIPTGTGTGTGGTGTGGTGGTASPPPAP